MKISTADLGSHPLEVKSQETEETLNWSDEEAKLASPVVVKLKFFKDGGKIFAAGEAVARISLFCSRCAESFVYDSKTDLDLEYVEGEEKDLPEDPEGREDLAKKSFFKGPFIDPLEDIRQSVALNIPMKPLCRQDCKGLCPRCKGNLNRNECRCDTRLA